MRIAAAQLAPIWGNKLATTDLVVEWIHNAAAEGVELVAFAETFLSGYPYWVGYTDASRFNHPDQKAAYAFYLDQAVIVDGPEVAAIVEASRETGVFVYIGITERSTSRGTVYATLLAIDPQLGVVSSHRKTMPTYDERMVWGVGDGNGLRVHDTHGIRVGGLNCWENWIPLARHSLYAQGVDLHVAVWPGAVRLTEDITRFIAKEGRCYVLSAGALLRPDDIASDFPLRNQVVENGDFFYDGGSAIAGPNGRWIKEPVSGIEGLVIADIDPATVRGERHNFDPAGHYFRADVWDVKVNRQRLGTKFED